MILIFSNRKVNLQRQGPQMFEPCVNPVGGEDVLLAAAWENTGGDWRVNLVPTPPEGSWTGCAASCAFLADLVKRMKAGEEDDQPGGLHYDQENKTYNWIFYIPGYSSTAAAGLEQARQLEQDYKANVMLFSWPADPPDITTNPVRAYRQAQAAARVSAIHLDQTLEQLAHGFAEPMRGSGTRKGFRFCLLMHSLGNYVFESFITNSVYSGETKIFDTIVLHQPDISRDRAPEWISKVLFRDSLYLTYNTFDAVLRFSRLINDVRAGVDRGEKSGSMVKFIDFTHGRHVEANHFMFTGLDNRVIKEACRRMILGVPGGGEFNLALDGAGGFTFHKESNSYVLNDPSWQQASG